MNLHEDWSELLRALTSRRVRFVIVGAHALAVLGRVRYTQDLDVLVEPTPANARRVLAALDDFGFGGLGLTAEDFTKPDHIVMLGRAPFGMRSTGGTSAPPPAPRTWRISPSSGTSRARRGAVRDAPSARASLPIGTGLIRNRAALGHAASLRVTS